MICKIKIHSYKYEWHFFGFSGPEKGNFFAMFQYHNSMCHLLILLPDTPEQDIKHSEECHMGLYQNAAKQKNTQTIVFILCYI